MRTSRVSALPYWWSARTYPTSAPSIGGVAERTHQEGNVVVLASVSYREGDCDFGEEGRTLGAVFAGGVAVAAAVAVAAVTLPREVAAGVEDQPVGAGLDYLRPQAGDSPASVGGRRG